jgi:hypothetical protein
MGLSPSRVAVMAFVVRVSRQLQGLSGSTKGPVTPQENPTTLPMTAFAGGDMNRNDNHC